MKKLLLIAIISFVCNFITAQSVGIGTTNPDSSAALEISSVTKGILVPRLTTAQRVSISNPATGLLVFDMTSSSFWFRSSTQWVELVDTANTVVHKSGTDIYAGMIGKVGIGTSTPSSKLEVKTAPGLPGITHTDGAVTLQTNTTASASTINTTTNHSLQLNANNGTNQFTITPAGNIGMGTAAPEQKLHVVGNTYHQGYVGIGNSSPAFPLCFAQAIGEKIALNGNGSSNFGFGIGASMMQMYTPNSSSAIGFGYGSSSAFTENMRLTGDGRLGIGTNSPSEKLSVSGNGNFSGSLTVGGGLAVGLGIAVGAGIAVAGGAGFGGAVSVGAPSPNASAQLEVSSTTKGFLMPRMNTVQRNAIPSPAEGLTVYNTDTHSPSYRTNNEWKDIEPDTASSAEQFVFRNSPDQIYMGLMDKVGIGTSTPDKKLQVKTLDNQFGISHTNGTVDLTTQISNLNGGRLGTASNHPLQLFSNNGLNQFVLTQEGFIGIGVNDPIRKFQVKTGDDALGISHTNGNAELATSISNTFGGAIGTMSNHPFSLFANAVPNQFVLTPQGNVGIGVNNPTQKFQVMTADSMRGIGHTNGTVDLSTYISNAEGAQIGTFSNHPLQLFTNNQPNQFILTQAGNVGIGTVTPHAPLQFSNTQTNRKVVLKEINNNNHEFIGLGVNNNSLRYQVAGSFSSHLFYAEVDQSNSKLLMEIDNTGEVGIGVASPENAVDIHAGAFARTGTHPTHLPFYATGDVLDMSEGFEFRNSDATQGIGLGKNTIYAAGSNTNQNIGLAAKGSTGAVKFLTNGIERMFVSGGGNIGIGTNTPHASLQFANSVANRKIVLFETGNNDNQYYGFGINALAMRYQVDGPGASHIFYAGTSTTTSRELLRITGAGDVGIGVSIPSASLEVARGTGSAGTAKFDGTNISSHFNFGIDENTYIRGGKPNAAVIINDNVGLGNIGLGISEPVNKVDIQAGSLRNGSHPTGRPLYITGDMDASLGIEFRHSNGSQGIGFGFNTIYATGNSPDQDLGLSGRGLGSIIFKTNQLERVRINGNGNVGIGTSSPNAPLQLANTIANRKLVLYESTNNDHQFYGLGINGFTLRYQVSGTTDGHVFYAGTSPTTSTELMRIQGNGNVGIGNGSPHAPLQFANTSQNRKIVMYENANNDHQFNGLGAEESIMRYQVGNEEYDHVFYAATSSSTSNELMRVKGSGDVDVSGKVLMGYSVQEYVEELSIYQPYVTVVCDCPPGTKVLGGGYYGANLDTVASRPGVNGDSWSVTSKNFEPTNHLLTVYAICARMGN